jgi:hypothetical protein
VPPPPPPPLPPPPGPGGTPGNVTLNKPGKIQNSPRVWKVYTDSWNNFLDTAPPGVGKGTVNPGNTGAVKNVVAWFDKAIGKLNDYKAKVEKAWQNATPTQKAKHQKDYQKFQEEYNKAMKELQEGKKKIQKLATTVAARAAASAPAQRSPVVRSEESEDEDDDDEDHHHAQESARKRATDTARNASRVRPSPRSPRSCP